MMGAFAQQTNSIVQPAYATYQSATDSTAKKITNIGFHPRTAAIALPGVKTLPADYYSKNLGFFCEKELQLEKAIKVPLRLRLGSVAYCDQLEGKNKR